MGKTIIEMVICVKNREELISKHCPDEYGYKNIERHICVKGVEEGLFKTHKESCEACWSRPEEGNELEEEYD